MAKLPVIATGLAIFAIANTGVSAIASPRPFITKPVLIAQSSNPPPNPSRKDKGKRGELFQQLNLSEVQKQQIASIRQKYQTPMRQIHEQLRATHDELEQLMAGTGSEAAIRSKHQEISSLAQKLADLRLESTLEIRKVLTGDQRSQLSKLMKARHDPRGYNPPGQGRPPGPPPEEF
jgi:Spy/CpxP family protein refolding chaperone